MDLLTALCSAGERTRAASSIKWTASLAAAADPAWLWGRSKTDRPRKPPLRFVSTSFFTQNSTLPSRPAGFREIGDLDCEQMMVHIHRGKDAKDRYIPLPTTPLVVRG